MADRAALRGELADQLEEIQVQLNYLMGVEHPGGDVVNPRPNEAIAYLMHARVLAMSTLVNLAALQAHEAADVAQRAQGDRLLGELADPASPAHGITIRLPDAFTAGEVNEILREWARTEASPLPPTRVRAWLEEEDRLFWAIARLRGRAGGSTTADEEEARELIHILTGGA